MTLLVSLTIPIRVRLIMIRIIADSTCNLPNEILEKYNVLIAPLTITVNGKTYVDYEEITPSQLYEQLPNLKQLPTTAAPSPSVFVEMFVKDLKQGIKDFIIIAMSSGTSATYQSAMVAKETFLQETDIQDVRIHVVDSLSMSHGSGYLIMKTGAMRDAGATFEELVEFNETYKVRVKHYLSVGDMDNLLKSGRLGHTSAIIGKMLKVEPIMTMKKGKGAICGKVRGKKKVIRYYVDEFKRRVDKEVSDFIIIGYTSNMSYAHDLKKALQAETEYSDNIYIMQIGAVVGTHVGLGGLSMFFIEKPKIKQYSDKYTEVKTHVKEKVAETIRNIKK